MLPSSHYLTVLTALLLLPGCHSLPLPTSEPLSEHLSSPVASSAPTPSPAETPEMQTPHAPQASATPLTLELAGIRLSAPDRFLEAVGQQVQLQAVLLDAHGQPITAEIPLTWSSSRPQDLSVNGQGQVQALVENGYTVIQVGVPGTDLSAELVINVSSPQSSRSGGGGGGSSGGGHSPITLPVLQITALQASSQQVQGTGSLIQLSATALLDSSPLDDAHFSWRCLQAHCNQFNRTTGSSVFWQSPQTPGQYILELTVSSGGRQVSQAIAIQVMTGPAQIIVNPNPQ